MADVRRAPLPGPDPALARAELEARLADLRRRLVTFGIFSSPLVPILIARTAEGVSMVEYLESRAAAGSRLAHRVGPDAVEDEAETEALYRDLLDYLDGRRTRLDWPLDLRMASSDFQRSIEGILGGGNVRRVTAQQKLTTDTVQFGIEPMLAGLFRPADQLS